MSEKSLSLTEASNALKAIRSANLETIEKEELSKLILNLSRHIAIVATLHVGQVIVRSVSCNYLKDDPVSIYPLKVSQISFNPHADTCGYNRASWQGESVFYGSVATEKIQPYYTSSFEVIKELSESPKELDSETFVVGKWLVIDELPLVHLSGNLKHNDLASSVRYNSLYESISMYPENIISLKMIDSYLCDEFCKEVPSYSKWLYKVSAAYADFVKKDRWPGLLYPSPQTDGAGYNVALFTENLNQYVKLERAALITYYKRGISIGNEIVMEAFPDGESLRWKEVYNHKMPPDMKRWYQGLSDDKSFDKYIHYEDL